MKLISNSILTKWQNTTLCLFLICGLGLSIRLYYFPVDVPIVTDGFFSFVYASKTVFDSSLPVGYTVTNSGWSNLLSLVFMVFDKTEPLDLMNVQRLTSIVLSTITAVPVFFIFKKFVNNKFALLGSLMIIVEPRLLLISIEGINYSFFFLIFTSTIALFLKKTNVSFFLSFVCIALLTVVRYEGILLIIPLSIIYLIKFRNKNSILLFLGMITTVVLILFVVGELRMEATQDLCEEDSFGNIISCGRNGYEGIFAGFEFYNKYIILGEQLSDDEEWDESYLIHERTYNKPNESVVLESFFVSFEKLFRYLGLILLPFFVFFIGLSLIIRIKDRKFVKWNFNSITILCTSLVMLLPGLYAYVRDINEIRYILILIPLIIIIGISFSSIKQKISNDNRIFVFMILFIIVLSVGFIEFEKRDIVRDEESFKIAKEIVSITDKVNNYHDSGYVKTAVLFKEWPELPKPDLETGKIQHTFKKISMEGFDSVTEFVISEKAEGLEFLVVGQDDKFFEELENRYTSYSFLELVYDSIKDDNFTEKYLIFKINNDMIL